MSHVKGSDMTKLFGNFCILVVCLGLTSSGLAWDSTGHMLIATLAASQLQPKAKREVAALLSVLQEFYPRASSLTAAAAWPDWIIGEGVNVYNTWHYIDIPYAIGVKAPLPASKNVVWAIETSQRILATKAANRLHKAIFLRFLLHFVGDVHQPLHCISRYDKTRPHGDRGGNDVVIQYGRVRNLHALWDQGVGLFRDANQHKLSAKARYRLAHEITLEYPRALLSKPLREHSTASTWAQESHELARHYAYAIEEGVRPSASYIHQGQQIVRRQLALAGYRLADILNQLYQ